MKNPVSRPGFSFALSFQDTNLIIYCLRHKLIDRNTHLGGIECNSSMLFRLDPDVERSFVFFFRLFSDLSAIVDIIIDAVMHGHGEFFDRFSMKIQRIIDAKNTSE